MAAQNPPPSDPAMNLALAVVASSTAPLVLLDGDLTVVAASDSFCRSFQVGPGEIEGAEIFQLGDGEWNTKRLRSLLTATLSGNALVEAYEMDLDVKGSAPRHLVLNAQKLAYGHDAPLRLLLAVADVTDARLAEKIKDDLVREKVILLQEVRHRVANSLQIIASVILQSARKVRFNETRAYLHDTHNRVMSVAALQQQLATSGLGPVALRPYFAQLCQSIDASMIHDRDKVTLDVDIDESTVDADVSVSLGLIVTELVINCLKHAFPDHRAGRIVVAYHMHGPDWTLSVSDDGIGMPKNPTDAPAGLGTSIVEALSRQLKARVGVTSAHPGAIISVAHTQSATVGQTVQAAL